MAKRKCANEDGDFQFECLVQPLNTVRHEQSRSLDAYRGSWTQSGMFFISISSLSFPMFVLEKADKKR
jgi:hypothetical protein